jgi:hypothetical protein
MENVDVLALRDQAAANLNNARATLDQVRAEKDRRGPAGRVETD